MKEKILSIIALMTIFIPLTVVFVWDPISPAATAIIIGYCIFSVVSFLYTLFLFLKMQFKSIPVKIALGVNAFYTAGIFLTAILPRIL